MSAEKAVKVIVVGVDGSEASIVNRALGPEPSGAVETRLVQGHPRHALIEVSRSADMLVLGRRGHGGFGGLLLGSVSSALVAHGHCPVLVVHNPEKK
jgi:nucleotide-binding universal stress UspA family protein